MPGDDPRALRDGASGAGFDGDGEITDSGARGAGSATDFERGAAATSDDARELRGASFVFDDECADSAASEPERDAELRGASRVFDEE